MLITVVSLFISALIGAPAIAKVVKRVSEKRANENSNSISDQTLLHEELESLNSQLESDLDVHLELETDSPLFNVESNEFDSTEFSLASQNLSHKRRSLIQVEWASDLNPYQTPMGATLSSPTLTPPSDQQSTQPKSADSKIDEVESVRATPSADQLLNDLKVLPPPSKSIVSAQKTPKKTPKKITNSEIQTPSFGQQDSQESSSETSAQVANEVRKKYINRHRRKVNPVALSRPRHNPLKMTIIDAPGAQIDDQHFEVITPTKNPQRTDQSWRAQGQPEFRLDGEQMWRSVEPLYIDFSDFFSLDFLVSIDRTDLYTPQSKSPGFIPDDEFEDEFDFMGEIPEWQKLLSGTSFLYTLKLKQQKQPTHIQLTQQSTEDQIVHNIISRS